MNRQPDKQKKDPIYREEDDEGSGNTQGTQQEQIKMKQGEAT